MQTFLLIIQLLPSLLKLIPIIEEIVKQLNPSGEKLGDIKKELIMSPVTASGTDSKTAAAVSKTVDAMVVTLNKIGLSSK